MGKIMEIIYGSELETEATTFKKTSALANTSAFIAANQFEKQAINTQLTEDQLQQYAENLTLSFQDKEGNRREAKVVTSERYSMLKDEYKEDMEKAYAVVYEVIARVNDPEAREELEELRDEIYAVLY